MTEEGLKLSEVIKLCEDGAYIKGDKFKNQYGQFVIFYEEYFKFSHCVVLNDISFEYEGNVYEVNK